MRDIRRLLLFSLMFLAIAGAAVVLAFFSYRAANQLATKSEESVVSSNRALGRKLVDHIEKVIIEGDRSFFRLVNLDDPREFTELWRRIVKVSPVILGVVVLDRNQKNIHFVTKQAQKQERLWFRKVFQKQILPDLELDKLPAEQHKHLHKMYGGKTYLLSYIRRKSVDGDYFIILNLDIPYLAGEIFRDEFKPLEQSALISVMDENGRVIYGISLPLTNSFVFEESFPTTLYKWRLQVAPQQIDTLSERRKVKRLTYLVLVSIAVSVMGIGLFFLFIAVRKEAHASRMKSEFVSNLSHELKTPLSLIHMFGELLTLGRLSEDKKLKEYATIITRESERLTALIDNVLDFGRMERGKVAYEFSEGNLGQVIERALEFCRYRTDQAGVVLKSKVFQSIPDSKFDESAMTLLLFNLVENATKYGAKQNSEIFVSLELDDKYIVLKVTDNGPGIPDEEKKRIFDRFYRGKAAQNRSVRGFGIGLSLVKNVVLSHNGTIEVRSELGKGATFEVRIPIDSSSKEKG